MVSMNKLAIIILWSLFTLLNTIAFTKLGYIISGDSSLPSSFSNVGLSGLYVWQNLAYSGSLQSLWTLPTMILYLLGQALAHVLGLSAAFSFGIWLPYAVSAIGIFLLIIDLIGSVHAKSARVKYVALLATILFVGHYSVSIGDQQILLALFPWFLLFLFRFVMKMENGQDKMLDFYLCTLSFSILVALGGLPYLAQNVIFLLLILMLLILQARGKQQKSLLRYSILMLVLVLLSNAITLYNLYILSISSLGQYTGSASNATLTWASYPVTMSLVSFMPIGSDKSLMPDIPNIPNLLDAVAILDVALCSVFAVANYKPANLWYARLTLSLLIAFFILVLLGTTIYLPLGNVFSYILHSIPYLLILRLPYVALHYILLFIIAVLFGIGSISLLTIFSSSKHAQFLLLLLMTAAVLYYAYAYDVSQVVSVNSTPIPQYVMHISNYINTYNNGYSIGVLPVSDPFQRTTWYYGTNVYASFIRAPVYTGGTSPFASSLFFPQSIHYYFTIGNAIGNVHANNSNLSNYLSILGIKYIIVQGAGILLCPAGPG